jgi:hypothetical protein
MEDLVDGPPLTSPAVRVRRFGNTALRAASLSHHKVRQIPYKQYKYTSAAEMCSQIICVCSNGVVELYKYGVSEEAKMLAHGSPAFDLLVVPYSPLLRCRRGTRAFCRNG